jgi:hypothetical protein
LSADAHITHTTQESHWTCKTCDLLINRCLPSAKSKSSSSLIDLTMRLD